MSPQKTRFVELLEELFQLNQPELDFGLYRIVHARSKEIRAFMQTELTTEIDAAFAGQASQNASHTLQAARQKVLDNLADDAFDAVGELKSQHHATKLGKEFLLAQQQARDGAGPLANDAQIYDHLYRFFSRYYDKGDFMSKRYFVAENDQRALPYAVPYDGREVLLHWANKDQYYIKSSEAFSNYTFDLTEALRKETDRQKDAPGFDFGPESGAAPLKVHLRLAAAAEGEHNNVKDSQERFYLIHPPAPVLLETARNGAQELVIQFEYRPDPDKTGQAGTWQQKLLAEAEATVLQALAALPQAQAQAFRRGLAVLAPTDKRPERTLLTKYLGQFADRNTMDYFIHKNLGGFLRRELDFYIKNEIMRLDDIESAEAPRVEAYLGKLRVLRRIAKRIIDFLAQLEDFQKKLWLKKKFVVDCQYCITLDRIPETLYAEIAANEKQREDWIALFAIDADKAGDLATPGYSVPLTTEFLRANQYLCLDTAHFSDEFKKATIASQSKLDENLGGILINADNAAALGLINERFNSTVKTIYIDPPYNTGGDGFAYKDTFRHSSWMTMVENRISASRQLLRQDGLFFSSIDRDENRNFLPLLFAIFGEENFVEEIVWQKAYGGGAKTKHINNLHEYVHAFATNKSFLPFLTLPPDAGAAKYYKLQDEKLQTRGKYRLQPLNTNSNDFRKNLTFPMPVPSARKFGTPEWAIEMQNISSLLGRNVLLLEGDNDNGWKFVDECGKKWTGDIVVPARQWQWGWDAVRDGLINNEIVFESKAATWIASYKQYQLDENGEERGRKPSSINIGPYTQSGTDEVRNMFGSDVAKYPKPVGLVKEFISIDYKQQNAQVLDYFAGSGTTGHAVIDINRDDGGSRKFLLIEMGPHFDKVLKPRMMKAAYSRLWAGGRPISKDGISHCFKYLRLESYEDTLNNLQLTQHTEPPGSAVDDRVQLNRDYTLHYWLNFETANSPSLLNVREFADPTAYKLKIKQPGSDVQVEKAVDLVETFNWLIGLQVALLDKPRTYAIELQREPDADLPEDQHTRWQATRIQESEDGEFWFRQVHGHVLTVPGDETSRERVLVVWRKLTGDTGRDQAALEAWLAKAQINLRDTEYATIYINGSHALPSDGSLGARLRLTEETFAQRMWEDT